MKCSFRSFHSLARTSSFVAGTALVGLLCWGSLVATRADPNFLLTLAPAGSNEVSFAAHFLDTKRAPLNGAQTRYILRLEKSELPPAHTLWSITLYDGRTQLLAENPIRRHMIISSMLPQLKRDPDGGLTLHIQRASPGADYETNWLPAPDGPFYLITRLYMPKLHVIPDVWSALPLQPVIEGRAVEDER